MNRNLKTLAAAAAALSAQAAVATPVPVFKDSFLVGVENLLVGDTAYDVAWMLSTCADSFGATFCADVNSQFPFTQTEALVATTALNDFMSTMDKTLLPGYNPSTGNTLTFVVTPFAIIPRGITVGGRFIRQGESVRGYATGSLNQTNIRDVAINTLSVNTYATYTPHVPPPPVPEPSTWLLMGLGLGALGLAARQRKASTTAEPA
jgi:hypothetical protein